MPWEKTRYEGVETKTLLVDRKTGVLTLLMKMAPGARLPDHQHVEIEQTYVLQGSLVCGEGDHPGGWRPELLACASCPRRPRRAACWSRMTRPSGASSLRSSASRSGRPSGWWC